MEEKTEALSAQHHVGRNLQTDLGSESRWTEIQIYRYIIKCIKGDLQ